MAIQTNSIPVSGGKGRKLSSDWMSWMGSPRSSRLRRWKIIPEALEGIIKRAAEDREHTTIESRQPTERKRAREKAETDAQSKALQHFHAEILYQQVASFEALAGHLGILRRARAANHRGRSRHPERESTLR